MNMILFIFLIIMFISFVTGVFVTCFSDEKEKKNSALVTNSNTTEILSPLFLTNDIEKILPMPIIEPDDDYCEEPMIIGILQCDDELI